MRGTVQSGGEGFSHERDARSARPEAPMLESAPASARPLLLTTVLDVAADEFLGVFFEHAIDLVQQGVELGADLLALRSDAALLGGIAAVLHGSQRLSLPPLFAHDLYLLHLKTSSLHLPRDNANGVPRGRRR